MKGQLKRNPKGWTIGYGEGSRYIHPEESKRLDKLDVKLEGIEINYDVVEFTGWGRWATIENLNDFKADQIGGTHYKMSIQPIEFIQKNEIPYCEANVIKYVCRHSKKNGLEDIKKAMQYLKFIAKHQYGEEL